jgi:hypothetical protein
MREAEWAHEPLNMVPAGNKDNAYSSVHTSKILKLRPKFSFTSSIAATLPHLQSQAPRVTWHHRLSAGQT